MKKFLTLALTAVLLVCASVTVLAEDVVSAEEPAEAAAAEEITAAEPLTLEGMTQVEVTTSDSNFDADVANFYDALPETRCTIAFGEDAEARTFSVYTATRVPEAIAKFAAIVDGEKGTVITIEVYGTNDSLLLDWTPLAFGPENLETEYAIFALADNTTPYAFYRFDFTLEFGDYFDIAELALFKVTTDAPEMEYDLGDVVEEGEIPAIVPVAEEAEAEEAAAIEEEIVEEEAVFTEVPSFGLFTKFPMPMYKFLPRG